jgi:uncharacterized protein (DUF697 family)
VSRRGAVAKIGPMTILSLVREMRVGAGDRRPIVVDGARELVPILARELRAGGDAGAVGEGGPAKGAAVYVWIGKPDRERLREASRARVPIVGVTEGESLPYVLDTDLVTLRAGEAMPVQRVAKVVARILGDRGTALAARLPVMRGPVVDELIRTGARRNALISAAIWAPGVDMPVLTLNQARLVLRIALAHGQQIDASRLPEVLGVVGAGFGFRTIAREVLGVIPFAGWAVKGAISYAGTRAVGEAARRRFAATARS